MIALSNLYKNKTEVKKKKKVATGRELRELSIETRSISSSL